jgi:hypothetical protein
VYRKINKVCRILLVPLILTVVLSTLPTAFAEPHPVVTVQGWATVKTGEGQIRGVATLELFLPSAHGPPYGVEACLSVGGYEYWWVIMDLWPRRNLAILITESVDPVEYPDISRDPVTIVTFHRTTPSRVLAYSRGLFFRGQIISCE